MTVEMRYGTGVLPVELPDATVVVQASPQKGLADEAAVLRQHLRSPLGCAPLADQVGPGSRVVVTHSDITRPVPNDRILPVVLAELEEAGVRREDILLLNALGTHRQQTEAELRAMLGADIVEHYQCGQHNAFADTELVSLGTTSLGNPVRLNKHLMEADFRVYTGFIEPHFFAGFSGGPKAVLPALAGQESVLSNHGRNMIADPRATWGNVEGNPIWEEMLEVALKTMPAFLLNVTVNAEKEITGVFAGDLQAAHKAGRESVRNHAMVGVEAPFDIVVVSNSGYPLDQNLYQTVKGMSAAHRITKKGGAIIMCAACQDGLPDHGRYAALLRAAGSPQGILDMLAQPGFGEQDQWQVQIQALVQLDASVFVFSEGLNDRQISEALLQPCRDVRATIAQLLNQFGPEATICAMPEGPATVAYVR